MQSAEPPRPRPISNGMKLVFAIILSVILLLLGAQIFSFSVRRGEIQKELSDLTTKLNEAKTEQAKFQAELDYYSNPANLEKELRARFNYKSAGENLIIIVPSNATSATSSPRTSE
jgi:hypothetical protein